MFREMRRKKQLLEEAEAIKILQKATNGVLAVLGDEDYPYAVPLSFYYDNENNLIYFHSAISGHKIDAINAHKKVSFCVVENDEIVPEKFTTYYKSAIAFGKASIVTDDDEKLKAIELISQKYSPNIDAKAEIEGAFSRMNILKIDIEYLTAKASIELI